MWIQGISLLGRRVLCGRRGLCGEGVSRLTARQQEVVEGGGEGDGEDVGGDVFEGEVAAEEDHPCECLAEDVDGGDGNEAAEFKQGGDDDGEGCEGAWVAFGQECGQEPIEGDGPEGGAEIFVEEPGEVEGEQAHGEAEGDGDEEEDEGGEGAAH